MAKRAPLDEQPFRPLLDQGVVLAALTKTTTSAPPARTQSDQVNSKVVEIVRSEPARPQEPQRQASAEMVTQRTAVGEGKAIPLTQPLVEKFDQEKRMLLTRTEAAALDRLVNSLATRLNTQVKLSHVLRSLVMLVLNAEAEVDRRAGEVPPLTRPPNGDGKALQRFEKEIAKVLGAAIRDAGSVRG